MFDHNVVATLIGTDLLHKIGRTVSKALLEYWGEISQSQPGS